VGDVHGNLDAMHKAIQTAKQEDRFLVWLGDVVDYGSENLRCIRTAYETVAAGRAHMIWGNHERKISRWISNNWGQQFRGRLSDANLATIREIEKLPADSLTRFHTAWQALENWSTQHWVTSNWMFTHGAATVNMWNTHNHRLLGMDQEHAYFGEVQDERAKTPEGYPVRTWDWVNSVPNNHTVVVGHDWLDHDTCRVTVKHGTQGGQVICVDTGSGKGGRLGGVAIDIETQKWEERYFDT
jgi:protein phosphatase